MADRTGGARLRGGRAGLFFDELGPQAGELVAPWRSPETVRLLREGGEGFMEAIEASGLEPPDTPLLEWSDLMTIEESLEREAVGELLERAIDDGHLVPGEKGWKERQVELDGLEPSTPSLPLKSGGGLFMPVSA